jgi:hypothetical protein
MATLKDTPTNPSKENRLEEGTYEIIRNRLHQQGADLRKRLEQLNTERKEVFGSIETRLLTTERISTEHNCVPMDLIASGKYFLFGYNVHLGLKTEISLDDVLSVYTYEGGSFHHKPIDLIADPRFVEDFKNLYRYYRNTHFAKFAQVGPHLFMVFQVGKSPNDIKTFKWLAKGDTLTYIDNRSDHELVYPEQYEFRWKRTTREQHHTGKHPHISIADKIFVETVGGDLTIKVENNTDTGKGIYEEEVVNKDQALDDAEIHYALIGNIIVLKVKPFQESKFRYIVYNDKLKEARRIDALEEACVLLPDDHGIIFPNGYYLQTGEYKLFDNQLSGMMFEKRISSPNGEDFLYVFYSKSTGAYALMSYNLIEQKVAIPIICHGYSIFTNGELCFFRGDEEQKKHHAMQLWQTPYVDPNYSIPQVSDSYLYRIGNKDIVRAMAECNELLTLIYRDDSYSDLYGDLVKLTSDIVDSYHWLNKAETYRLDEPLLEIRSSASAAIDEFEKVVRMKASTRKETERIEVKTKELFALIRRTTTNDINEFVKLLSELRILRGEIISLKDLRYVDTDIVNKREEEVKEQTAKLSASLVDFLLQPTSLQPYEKQVTVLQENISKVEKVVDANKIEEDINRLSGELEMLIDIVSNLKIEDTTQTTRIIDGISAIYSHFNQIKAALRKKRSELMSVEGKAEFSSQLRLIDQGIINYLDVCDTPAKCDEYLTRLMIQLEELSGRFAEFDEFTDTISEKREEIYNAFESRKTSLVEASNKRSSSLQQSAERIIKGIQQRVATFKTASEINGYFASDLMADKVREIVKQLQDLGDSIKAEDVQTRLKTVREEAIRQLKDKNELFSDGGNLIRMGKHSFSVNTQPLDLTLVYRNGAMYYHLTGTNFYEKVENSDFEALKDLWEQSLPSENSQVYRAEYLAYLILQQALQSKGGADGVPTVDELALLTQAELQAMIAKFMAPRYSEGYIKGVHDNDAALILHTLLSYHQSIDLLRYPSPARACAALYWHAFAAAENKEVLNHRLKGVGLILQVFPKTKQFGNLIEEIQTDINGFVTNVPLFGQHLTSDAGEYLFYEISRQDHFIIDEEAANLYNSFTEHLQKNKHKGNFESSLKALEKDPAARYKLIRKWLHAFTDHYAIAGKEDYLDEVAVLLFANSYRSDWVKHVKLHTELQGLQGTHPVLGESGYQFHYNAFMSRLKEFSGHTAPRFERLTQMKKELADTMRAGIRLEEFKPAVLTSFVRNKLIDQVYLPLIGDNLAKQIGASGDTKRTDRMGMLLLISPPGYGKTTLMEYIASRLGIVFMKINGPAIGHKVTSLDPADAPNAAAKQELEKLALSLEMGDNVMIYVDDIQHCNPEFLQKFISLCDAQRKIEAVYKGKSRTYDLRGRKVCVVMAGNPYTESGDKFQIPDMLTNRSDVYNLGDIIGSTEEAFKLSYIENSLTANPILQKLVAKSHNDIFAIIRLAETGSKDGISYEASHSAEEINEYVSIMKKLLAVRDVMMTVNKEYILSAAQADEYRTEPPFKLQGSYRNMNKIAEKLMPLMNDKELQTLIMSHYENEAQTLATGAESNLLKFKELTGIISPAEQQRWTDIKTTFVKNNRMKGFGSGNQLGQAIVTMEAISEGLSGIKNVLKENRKDPLGLEE